MPPSPHRTEPAPLLLVSTSPRRYFLLREAGIPFEAVAPRDVAEDFPAGEAPADLVVRHAAAKARSVAGDYPGRLLLGADTVVVLDGVIYGKPAGEEEAREMLATLQGRTHTVYTGLALLDLASEEELTEFEATEVTMRPLGEEEIASYVATGEPLDKAGAYAIQGRGAFLVKRVDGDYFNVVGLPLYRLSKMLQTAGRDVFR
ncbi:MAG: septum formation protein Maf [Candidatus Coatesbacteria bacterium]|nr:MAG: septum formation protein Maf [Candidatus Coatesbacteria bacterium]